MTWGEYYADVMNHAWKRGWYVIWIDPPPVRSVPVASLQTSAPCATLTRAKRLALEARPPARVGVDPRPSAALRANFTPVACAPHHSAQASNPQP